jgi:hypothetical protein
MERSIAFFSTTLDLVRVTMAGWHGTLDRDTWPSLVGRHRQLEFPCLAKLILDLGDKNVDCAGCCSIETVPPVKRVFLDRLVLEHGSKMLLDWVYYVVRKPIVFNGIHFIFTNQGLLRRLDSKFTIT